MIGRREFITLLGGAAAAWPLAAQAQQGAKRRTIGFLGSITLSVQSPWVAAFVQRLREVGWIEGRLSNQSPDLASKQLELLRDVVPGLRRLGIIANVGNPATVLVIREVEAAARTLGLEVATPEIRRAENIVPAFEALEGRAPQALYVAFDPLVATNLIRINTLAVGARLPTMHGNRDYVEAGGLMSYGTNTPDLWRRAGDYVDKILRGAKPADLPVGQPTKFDLVVNLTTAKALRLKLPESFLARADEVIE
jgi:putative ABC transport system substrate-binding protein